MTNNHLNLPIDDMKITSILIGYSQQLIPSISNEHFKKILIELDNIRNDDISESDDDLICDIYDNLSKSCPNQLAYFKNDTTLLNSGESFGALVDWLMLIS